MSKKKNKTKTVNTPWSPAQPAILGAINTSTGIVNSNQPHLDELAGGIRGQLPQLQAMAFGPNASLDAANGYAQDVLDGKYLNGNPYLEGMISNTANDVGNRVNSTFSMAGRTGGGANQFQLSKGLANAENTLRYGDYDSERNRMTQAAGMVPSLTQAQFAGIPAWLGANETAGQLPYAGVGALSPVIGLAAGSGTSKTTEKKGWGQMILDAAAAAASSYAQSGSDIGLKDNVVRVGDIAPGLGLYEWDYKQDLGFEQPKGRFRGVLAQEVAKVAPWALGTPEHGYMTVRYTPEKVG